MTLAHLRSELSDLLIKDPNQFFTSLSGGETDEEIRELKKGKVQDLGWLIDQFQENGAYIQTKSGHSNKPKALQDIENKHSKHHHHLNDIPEECLTEGEDSDHAG